MHKDAFLSLLKYSYFRDTDVTYIRTDVCLSPVAALLNLSFELLVLRRQGYFYNRENTVE